MIERVQRRLVIAAAVASLIALDLPAIAYPTMPIDLYIGSAPSGSTDALGRVLSRSLEAELGQPVVVHNVPGAGGAVMATRLMNSAPDGYSLGLTISHAYTGNPVVMPDVTPYSVGDFTHLATVSKGQCALVTSTNKPYRTLEDLIAAAKDGEQPVFASQSPLTRIVVDYIARAEDIRFRVITVQGGGEIMQNILGGHADFGFSGGPHVNYVAAGQMRVLASVEDARLLSSPEVPTLKELGYDISSCSTFVVSAPPGLPEAMQAILSAALQQAIASPAMQTLISNLQYPEHYLGPADVTAALNAEAGMLERAVASIAGSADSQPGDRLSPAFMPIVAATLGGIAVVALCVAGLFARQGVAAATATRRIDWTFVGAAAAVMAAAFAIMTLLGYLPGAAVMVAGFMALGRASLRVIIGSAILLPVALWLLFAELLGFPLP